MKVHLAEGVAYAQQTDPHAMRRTSAKPVQEANSLFALYLQDILLKHRQILLGSAVQLSMPSKRERSCDMVERNILRMSEASMAITDHPTLCA
jgi:hypothetical protein